MPIFPPRGRLPEIAVTVADVTIVDGHHLVAGDLDHGLLHDGAAQVLNHGPVRIFTNLRDSEGQAGSPWNDHVVRAEVRESNQQLLILINRARVVCNHDGLPHSFDPQGLAEAPIRIKLASEFARSHDAFEPTQQPSNEASTTPRWMTSLSRTPRSTLTAWRRRWFRPPRPPYELNASGDNLQILQDS